MSDLGEQKCHTWDCKKTSKLITNDYNFQTIDRQQQTCYGQVNLNSSTNKYTVFSFYLFSKNIKSLVFKNYIVCLEWSWSLDINIFPSGLLFWLNGKISISSFKVFDILFEPFWYQRFRRIFESLINTELALKLQPNACKKYKRINIQSRGITASPCSQ